mgnify:CR=1 FL=1
MLARVFFDVHGQDDNLGDSVLSRAFFERLRPFGDIYLFGGANSSGYLASREAWMAACRRPARGRTTVMTMNSGESFMSMPRRSFGARWMTTMAVRLGGGVAIHCGHGLREQVATWRPAMNLMLSICQVVSWRDPVS